jgi:hypothetical protein
VARLTTCSGASDDTANIHLDWRPNNYDGHEVGRNPKIESLSDVCLLRL